MRIFLISLSIVSAFISWTYIRYRHDLRSAHERVANAKTTQTACGPIEYVSVGSGMPLLVVHGAGGGFDQGLDLADELAVRGFRVIAMSRFGYLGTPLPKNASAAAQADAHACLLDALGISRAAIMGVSAGGPSTIEFALRHPDRCAAMVLLVPAAYVPRPNNAPSLRTPSRTQLLFDSALRSDFLFWLAPKLARNTFIENILGTPAEVVERASAKEQARILSFAERILPVTSRRLGLLNDATVLGSLTRFELEKIRTPT